MDLHNRVFMSFLRLEVILHLSLLATVVIQTLFYQLYSIHMKQDGLSA
jgi:hypothetical protein